jgi:hypothetical protein
MWGGPWTEADARVGLCFGAKHHEWSDRSSRVRSEPGPERTGRPPHCESCCELLPQDKHFIVL